MILIATMTPNIGLAHNAYKFNVRSYNYITII